MLVSCRGSNLQSQKGSERPSPSLDRELKLLTVVGPGDCACVCLKTQGTSEKEAHPVLHSGVITCFQGSIKEWGKNLLDFDQMSVVVLLIDWLVDWQDRRLVLLLHAPLQ